MTDDKEDKTLEHQEHFQEVAKSKDVEVLEGKSHFVEFGGNLVPVTKSGEQLSLKFWAFRENRLPFDVRVKDPHSEPLGRVAFMREPKVGRADAPQTPICNLNVALQDDITEEMEGEAAELSLQRKHQFLRQAGYGKFDTFHRADLRISDIGNLLGSDWIRVGRELGIEESDINIIQSEYPENEGQQAMVMLRLWINSAGNRATGNELEKVLRDCDREDIVQKCISNLEVIEDEAEVALAKSQFMKMEDSGFAALNDDLGRSMTSPAAAAAAAAAVEPPPPTYEESQEIITTEKSRVEEEEIITEKTTTVVQEETPQGIITETITTTTTTTSNKPFKAEEEEDDLMATSAEHDDYEEKKYSAEEKAVFKRQSYSSSVEEEDEEEEEEEVIEERRQEIVEEIVQEQQQQQERMKTPPPSPDAEVNVQMATEIHGKKSNVFR